MKTTKPTAVAAAKPIDICDAIQNAKLWQGQNSSRAKAFLVPVGDLLACFLEMGIATYDSRSGNYTVHENVPHDLRMYMGNELDKTTWPDPKKGFGNKLLIVGTKFDKATNKWVDIIDRDTVCPLGEYDGDGSADGPVALGGPTGSGVYDLTTPCPNECDPTSPLY